MKTQFLYVNSFLKTIYVLLFFIGTTYGTFAQANPRLTSVNPTTNLAIVKITNFGDAAIDLSDYWLCLRPGTYRQLNALDCEGDLYVMPSGSITVSYTVPVGIANDGLSLYLPNTTSNGGFGVAANLIDFVQWGAAGNIREPLAVTQGLWTAGDFISGAGPYTYIGNGTENGLSFWSATCDVNGGEITGGPFNFTVDGSPDNVSGVSVSGSSGSNASWVITDDQGTILGLPPTVAALEGVDFDGAGVGTCLIWYIRYEDGLEGLSPGNNALTDLSGCYDLSNSITVVRNEQVDGGEIDGGPFTFCVDGEADNVSDISLSGNIGSNSTWVITDDLGTILGLPPTIAAVEGVDFDGAGAGVCLIWHLSYADGLEGLSPGNNALTDLSGTYDLSNSISVTRNAPDGGEITGGPFNFTVDGSPDNVSGVSVSGSSGSNASWVITDDQGTILGLPPTVAALEGVDFDGAGVGTCLIWYIRYEDGLEGLSPGNNALTDLSGCYDLSNSITVVRNEQVDGGEIDGGPFTFCVDGEADNVSDISLSGNIGSNTTWVITDDQGLILGLPPTIAAVEGVDFDGAGAGVCLIWHLSYADGLEGLSPGNNALTDLSGTYDLSNSISVTRNAPDGGEITGGPFNFTVDGSPDNVSGVSVSGSSGSNASWVITDDQGTILGLPPTVAALEGVDFDGAGVGTCLIWYIRYEDGLEGLSPGNNALTDLSGCYDLSNSITVVRNEQVDGGEIDGGPFTFCVDGAADNVSDISLSGNIGSNTTWVITDDQGLILGLPPTIAAVEGVDFDGAGAGVCLIWHLSYADGLEGLSPGNNALTDLSGTYDLSNSISVTRNAPDGGEITGGPFNFTVDGSPDNVSGVSVSGSSGSNASWVITDDQGTILGLPPTVAALEGVDFDGAGVGTCLIWYIRYEDGLEGLSPGNNALTDLSGCYDLSNSITVVRNEQVDGGEIDGGPFTFCVDGEADNVSDISLSGNIGSNSTWVITDDLGTILGLPPTIAAVEGVDFDGAGAGVCLIWHLSYADGLEGLSPGNNALTDLSGTYDLSNSISVTRNAPDGGEITGGPFNFTVDGTPDNVSGVSVSGSSGSNASWVITDDRGTILGLPPTVAALEGVDFDGAGVGTCLIWYIRYEDGLEGLSPGNNALTDLSGCYDLSNSITVVRNEQVDGGEIDGGPFTFCVDGAADNVSDISLSGNIGSNTTWVITDDQGLILGLPPTIAAVEGVDFDGAGAGVCLIWHLSYADGLEGLSPGNNALTDLSGTYDLSNSISVTRNAPDGGEITGGPFNFTVDGSPDNVSGVSVSGSSGSNASWVITDDQGTILGLPPTVAALEGVDFDGAGVGTCLIWYIRYEDGLEGLSPGNNALTDLSGCYDLSNSITVVRNEQIELNVIVFPIPASRFVNVILRGVINSDPVIQLYDMSGNPVNVQTFQRRNFIRINVSSLSPGVYLLSVRDDLTGASTTRQIVVRGRF